METLGDVEEKVEKYPKQDNGSQKQRLPAYEARGPKTTLGSTAVAKRHVDRQYLSQ